ncbi:MAG: M23 family metallopeptidase [Thermodesulfobacteriota bacterium]
MIKNNYTIFVSPPKAGKTRNFSFRKSTLYILIFLLFLFIIGDFIAIVKYRESAKLNNENIRLKTEKSKLEEVAQIVDEIKKEESFIRDFLGLEKSGSNMGGLGLGGIGPRFIDTSRIIPLEINTSLLHKEINHCVSLIEKALCLKKDLQELKGELIDRKSDWDTKPTIMPLKADEYWISSGFGWRKSPFTGLREFHRGLDISGKRGTPIIAPADGTVISAGKDLHFGKFVKIKHSTKFTTLYGHMLRYEVKKGQKVKRGDIIGLMGNTGISTGYHLHYTVIKDTVSVNPCNHILNPNNSGTMMALR